MRRGLDWRVGAVLLGGVMTFSVAVFKPIGVSTAYCTSWGMVLERFAPDFAASHPYLTKVGTSITAEWMLVIGVILGGLFAARLGRGRGPARLRESPSVPRMWAERFGPSAGKRFLAAGIGGFLFLFGARLAGGCTSGHVMSGISQLALSGMVFAAGTFASGILTAKLLYARARS